MEHKLGISRKSGGIRETSISKLTRAAEAALENAQHLYAEAELLKAGDCKARAYFLFQASIEECGLIDLLSNWAINVMRGEQFDEDRLRTVFRGRSERIAVSHANSSSLFVAIGPDGISTPKATVSPDMLTDIAGRNEKLLSNMADKLELALQWQKNVPLSGLVQSAVH